jgi:Tfp pilus assembly protein PilF
MDHAPVEIQFSLAKAALASGDEAQARKSLSKVIEAGPRRIGTPVSYVRSLVMLAQLEEKEGRAAEAGKLYERYLQYWKHGQIDRAEVAKAGQRLAALRARAAA